MMYEYVQTTERRAIPTTKSKRAFFNLKTLRYSNQQEIDENSVHLHYTSVDTVKNQHIKLYLHYILECKTSVNKAHKPNPCTRKELFVKMWNFVINMVLKYYNNIRTCWIFIQFLHYVFNRLVVRLCTHVVVFFSNLPSLHILLWKRRVICM